MTLFTSLLPLLSVTFLQLKKKKKKSDLLTLKELIEETQVGFIQAKPSDYFKKFTKQLSGVADR